MKIFRYALISSISLMISCAFAHDRHFDYGADYYEDEGGLLFKVRGAYIHTPSKLKDLPDANAGEEKPNSLVQHGYGFDTATTYFFTDNIAAELSLGVNYLRVKSTDLEKAGKAFGDNHEKVGKNNAVWHIPLAATLQYHIMPFGGIDPYIGGGYHASYMYTRSKSFKVRPGHGPVIQAGVDFIAKDDTIITVDVRQYFLSSRVKFKNQFLAPEDNDSKDVGGKVKWDPLVVSVGIGFKL